MRAALRGCPRRATARSRLRERACGHDAPVAARRARSNLHPTTSLLAAFPGDPDRDLPPGVLALSSRSAVLYASPEPLARIAASIAAVAAAAAAARAGQGGATAPARGGVGGAGPSRGAAAMEVDGADDEEAAALAAFDRLYGSDLIDEAALAAAQAGVRRLELATYALPGLPAACAQLGGGPLWAVCDSAAGLHALCLPGPHGGWCTAAQPVAPASLAPLRGVPGTVACAAAFFPGSGGGSEGGVLGHLVLGSRQGSSQVWRSRGVLQLLDMAPLG